MKELGAFLLAFLSAMSYFVLATQLALYQRWPIVHLLGCLVAVALLGMLVAERSGARRLYAGAMLALALFISGVFTWYTLDFSIYDDTAAAVEIGEDLGPRLAGLELASQTGDALPVLRPGEDRATLLVFYRGFW